MTEQRTPLITRQEGAALVSCLVNLILTVAKFVLFYAFVKSVSLKAEAWHSLSDIGSSFVVFLALYLPRRQALKNARAGERRPEETPPSHSGLFSEGEEPEERGEEKERVKRRRAKPEDIVAVGIASLFIVVCLGIFLEILQPVAVQTDYALVVAAGMLVMAFVSHLLYKFEYHVGIESDSPALIADGYHSKIDMYGSILVAVALVSQRLGLGMADRAVAAVICLVIVGHAVEVLAMAARHYLGRPLGEEAHTHGGALADVYALTGKWGEGLSRAVTLVFARIFFIDRSRPDLGRRVGRRVVLVMILAVVMLYALSGLFVCGPGERAFVERFGKPTSMAPYGPGLHCCWPWPIDRVVKVDTGKIRTFYLGSPIETPGQPILWTNRHYSTEFRFLTGDDNFLAAYLGVHFRISEPYKFLYECADPLSLLGSACLAKVRELAGTNNFFDCLTTKRPLLEKDIRRHLAGVVGSVGLEVLVVAIRDMHPPIDVAPSFEAVISAMEEREALINEAKAYRIGAVPFAKGRAADILARARADKTRAIETANARVSAFVALQKEYALAKDITTAHMYLQMIEETIARTLKWVVLTEDGAAPLELWFPRGNAFWRWNIGAKSPGDVRK